MKLALLLLLLLPIATEAADGDLILSILKCESGFRSNVWGDDHKSYGIAQFQKETFYRFARKAKVEMQEAKLWPPNWKNPQHQVFLLNWGLDNGYGKSWTCYLMIKHIPYHLKTRYVER